MRPTLAPAFALLLAGCQATCQAETPPSASTSEPATAATEIVDSALLRELLGESVRIDGDRIRADGMLIRLAFEPLIRQTGPVALQLSQGQGYRLTGIADGSPLWLLGLRDGDVLTAVDGQPILGREHELRSTFEARPSRAELTYLRGSESRTTKIEIASGSAWRSSVPDPLAEVRQRSSSFATVSPSVPPEEILAGLRCVAADLSSHPGHRADGPTRLGRCELERKALEKLLDSPDALARSARIVPAMEDGQPRGFKLYGIRPQSVPGVFGLQNGDLITGINDRALTSLEGALETYSQLRDAKELRIQLERRNVPYELEIAIVDALSAPG